MPSRPLSLLAVALTTLSLVSCVKTSIECSIEPRPPLTTGGPVQIRFALTNPTDETVWVLPWNTPLEQRMMGTIFTLTGPGGEEIPYQGPMAKRGAPEREAYIEIEPGRTAEVTVDLAQVYDLTKPGRHRLQVTGSLFDLARDTPEAPGSLDELTPAPVDCNEVVLEVK